MIQDFSLVGKRLYVNYLDNVVSSVRVKVRPPLAAVGVGLGIALIGVAMWIAGWRLTSALHQLYARLPGCFQYPAGWHRLIGGLFVAFGVVILVTGAALADR